MIIKISDVWFQYEYEYQLSTLIMIFLVHQVFHHRSPIFVTYILYKKSHT